MPARNTKKSSEPKVSEPARRRLTLYLLNPGLTLDGTKDDILADGADKLQHEKIFIGSLAGHLFSQHKGRDVPWWKDVAALTGTKTSLPKTMSASAMLLVEVFGRLVALTYGGGRHFLNESMPVDRFGLAVVLNCVDPNKIRTIDHARVESSTRLMKEQSSTPSSTTYFGIDVAQDLLSSVVGKPSAEHHDLGSDVIGKDSLILQSVAVTAETLEPLLCKILSLASSTAYKKEFPWVDNIKMIEHKETVSIENDRVLRVLLNQAQGELEDVGKVVAVSVLFPAIVDWERVAGFRYAKSSEQLHGSLELEDFLSVLSDKTTVSEVRRRKIFAVESSGDIVAPVSAWKCISAEVVEGVHRRILHGGAWYEVDEHLVESVDSAYASVPVLELDFPPFDVCDGSEEAKYVRRIAEAFPGCHVLDGQPNLVAHGGGPSKIEICDLLMEGDGRLRFVHFKRYGGSETLSHLFAQGLVSVESYLYDADFRRKVMDKLPPNLMKIAEQHPREFDVTFAIIRRKCTSGRPDIPFFSRLNLRNVVRRLDGYRVGVSVKAIGDLTPSPPKSQRGKKKRRKNEDLHDA